MSIEKSIQNLIKAIQQPTRYMGDEPSIKVVPKPGNDPCAPLFEAGSPRRRKTGIAAVTICDVLEGINSCDELNRQNFMDCKLSKNNIFVYTGISQWRKATILNPNAVDGICDTYANSVLAATKGLSEIQKIEIKRMAKCKCYKYAIEGEPSITPPPSNGIQTIFPKHLQEQIVGSFYGFCSIIDLRERCNSLTTVRNKYYNSIENNGLGCQLSTPPST